MAPEQLPVRLAIMGKMAAGKTTAADHLMREYGATTWTIAERIKQVAHALIDQTGNLGDLLEVIVREPQLRHDATVALLRYADAYEPEPGSKPRGAYQQVGQILRDLHPSTRLCWEADLQARIDATSSDFVVVDMRAKESHRFFCDEQGYASLRIDASEQVRRARMAARDGAVPTDELFRHQSETDVDELEFDFVIANESADPSALYERLDRMVAVLRAGGRSF